ncbi:TPA: conjugal transfer protein TrbD [Legionella pneumophila]|uniref:Conjugal transfer protein TrbD n=1 Tax=Legionella pneumophila TaxID=446 RepID=A0AAP9BY85_LEGPN|nr:conjugal transfer protein TrbD [Legionella pneumophila]HCC3257057.1 conjugal transfer protein TrbD [Legionella pneumophila subsp. pneumophila]AMV15193.1 Type IV secretory pathway, VirB3-like protein [Legionella pneumophila]MBN5929884.1 conjugal transfer protein TrbD [Legionella pneumophila]MDF1929923.1 conjugal transfer protein TrbD [Legionella pneumophila]PYB44040.1 conjugal transfer protein TrbD [Legionella pneumophila]
MSLRTIPIRRCGNRPSLFMGGDRELVMFSGLLSAILVFAAQDWLAALFGFALWFLSLKGLRLMAKADPYMRAVYLRQRGYQAYYQARSTPFRNNKGGYL